MNIHAHAPIAGYPALLIRNLTSHLFDMIFDISHIAYKMKCSPEHASQLAHDLAQLKLIKLIDDSNPQQYILTNSGVLLANATAAQPLHRHTALQKIEEFLLRVQKINRTPYYLYRITEVRLFGSLLTTKTRPGDIDLAIHYEPKDANPTTHERALTNHITNAIRSGQRFNNITDRIEWPQIEMKRFLKSRSQAFSIHNMDELHQINTPSRIIFPIDDHPTQSPTPRVTSNS